MKRFILITIAICSTAISMAQTDNIIRKKSTNVVSTVISNSTQKKNGSYTAPRKKTSTTSRKRAAKNGYGKEQYDGGSWYEGNFVNGTPSGQGTYHLADGMRIEGPFVDGVPHGESTIYFSDGTIFYKGNMSNGEICGEGIMVRGDSIVAQGVWSDNGQTGENINVTTFDGDPLFYGNIVNGNYTNGLLYEGYDISVGQFDSNGKWQIEGYARRAQVLDGKIVFTINNIEFTMIEIGAGSFDMGTTKEHKKTAPERHAVHKVTLSQPYCIGETEVTQELWQTVMQNNPSRYIGNKRPVTNVSWNDCIQFVTKLSEYLELDFSLPTEAQWEYAARGGNKSKHFLYCGSNKIDDVAWNLGSSGNKSETYDVKMKLPNELGLYDMSGNVAEWCLDWYGEYTSNPMIDPKGPLTGSHKVSRGGDVGESHSFFNLYSPCVRRRDVPTFSEPFLGFRMVLN